MSSETLIYRVAMDHGYDRYPGKYIDVTEFIKSDAPFFGLDD